MGYELQVAPAPQTLAEVFGGKTIELRELTYGQMRAAMRAGAEDGHVTESLLAASLHVDGNPVGLDALFGAPGRFAGDIATALQACVDMHGLKPPEGDAAEGEAPKH